MAVLWLGGRVASPQDTYKETRAAAAAALARGAYEDAIPPLRQLVEWFGDTDQPSMRAEMEDVFYHLGLCHMFLAQFAECRNVFDTYLKKFPYGANAHLVAIFIADTWRYEGRFAEALGAYQKALKTYEYSLDLRIDIFVSMARCHLAEEKWEPAEPLLLEVYRTAPDLYRRNWAAAMLATSYLKDGAVDKVYPMVPLLLQRGSFASRSVALNMAALEAGDELFADDKYRDALWIYRLVYPHDLLRLNAQEQLELWRLRVRRLQRHLGLARELLRAQETVAEIEAELEAIEKIPNYDVELMFRIARSYMETRRLREASDLFYHLHLDAPADKQEECLYLSFLCAVRVRPPDRCLSRGHEYLDRYPGGPHYDAVSLMVGQVYANEQNWPKVLQVLGRALEVSPKHEDIAEVLFLLGYASFMEEKLADAQAHFGRILREFPGSEREVDALYWLGMSFLFDRKYEEARPNFDRLLQDFAASMYAEDALFRSATCDYALAAYEPAERKLLRFLDQYPGSKLLGEAHVLLGDISGALGELEEAVRRYTKGMESENLNIELYNHAAFRTGEMLRELKRYDDAIRHFEAYIARARPESNVPLAIYWMGECYWDKGEPERTLALFLDAVARYGGDRSELGVDLILEKFVDRSRAAGRPHGEEAWARLRDMLKRALEERQYTLALRLERVLMYDAGTSDAEKAAMAKFMLREENLRFASAGVLEWIVDAASAANQPKLARAAAEALIRDFTETDYALAARRLIAEQAVAEGDLELAIVQYNIIREVYATSDAAADALMRLGRLYAQTGQYDLADAAYRDLLGAKEWKDRWPEALYARGQLWMARRKFEEASAYFERIYVLYGGHKAWVGKAYLARAECLAKLGRVRAATETLDEFLARSDLADLPEFASARELRQKLGGRM
ncbi:MAG: tetratricopeptide repeat protein [Kiritimatiellae bacterium]|nr:tetratricopeptide repeat protein [Kiritimatiellia bacterium]